MEIDLVFIFILGIVAGDLMDELQILVATGYFKPQEIHNTYIVLVTD